MAQPLYRPAKLPAISILGFDLSAIRIYERDLKSTDFVFQIITQHQLLKVPYQTGEVSSCREYRPSETTFEPHCREASAQPHPHNPRKQRGNPAATGRGERFREGKWRRKRDCGRTFSGFRRRLFGFLPEEFEGPFINTHDATDPNWRQHVHF